MKPYSESELTLMRQAFWAIEALWLLSNPETLPEGSKTNRRLNKSIVEELDKPEPDHAKINYLLNAINSTQDGKQQTTKTESPKEEPKSEKAEGLKRWFQKGSKNRK